MRPSFNTAGPCFPDEHYMLPPERRLGRVRELIDDGKVFTVAGAAGTGKTTSAEWLVRHYNSGERFHGLCVNLETARDEPAPAKAILPILRAIDWAVQHTLPALGLPSIRAELEQRPATAILQYLHALAHRCPRPLVVLFDEADRLVGETGVSFLAQLRAAYIDRRDTPAPHSMALIGQRDVRTAVTWLGSASPFNIVAEATTIAPFTEPEVPELLAQHTAATGQRFEPAALARIFALSQGHPWLVNALADQIVDRDVRDRSVAVTADHVEIAKETIIVERRTHVDSLIHKLRAPRVRKILDPMLVGAETGDDVLDDDLAYVIGLGIVRMVRGRLEIANPMYREIVPRALNYVRQIQIDAEPAAFVRADGSLDMPKLIRAWQTFWRKDGHLAAEGFSYREAGPHLMLMAFLQRVVNGGGRIEREYALGKGALDLLIEFRAEKHAIEVKLRRDTETEDDGLSQVAGYLDRLGLGEGWLVMFDLRSTLPWDERLTTRTVEVGEKKVRVVGC